MPLPAEQINKVLRKELCCLHAKIIGVDVHDNEVMIRRVKKSIALRVSKLLCEHRDIKQTTTRNPANNTLMRRYHCGICKSCVYTYID